jgi:hypothetical protein
MLKHTVPQDAVSQQTANPTNSPLSHSADNPLPDDHYLRMLRFYLDSKRWVEEQISAELEFEIGSELQNLDTIPADWGW